MKIHALLGIGVASFGLGGAGLAQAGVLLVGGDVAASAEQTGATFLAEVGYVGQTATSGLLTISLLNLSPDHIGGHLTGLAFATESDVTATLLGSSSAAFEFFTGGHVPHFNVTADFGVALGGDFTGGGAPNVGVPSGGVVVVAFSITGSDAGALTVADFASGFYTRYRGLADGRSDTVGVAPLLPAPGAAAVAGMGMLVATRRRR